MLNDFKQLAGIEDKQERSKARSLRYIILCSNFIGSCTIDRDRKGTVVQISLKSEISVFCVTKVSVRTIEQNGVIDSVEGCAEIKQYKKDGARLIHIKLYVIFYTKQGSLFAVG